MKNQKEGEVYLLQVNVPKPERFNGITFGTYTHPKTGKTVYLKNANGQLLANGFTCNRLAMTFNTSKIFDANVVLFLTDYPGNGTEFTLTNSRAKKEEDNSLLLKQIECEGKIFPMQIKDLKVICASLGYTYDDERPYLLSKIVRKIRQEDKKKGIYGVDEVLKIIDSKDAKVVFDIKEMLKYKIITKKPSGVYVYGEFSVGLNLDQITMYMQDNLDVYAGIKKDLRVARKDEPELETEDILDLK